MLPEKKNILDYAVDSINGLVYCVANHPDNSPDNFSMGRSALSYKREGLVLYKLEDKQWVKVGDGFDVYGEQALFTFEKEVFWSVQHKVSVIGNEKIAMSDVYLLTKDGLEKKYQDIRGNVSGFIRYKGEIYMYGSFWPEEISKDKKCGLMKWDQNHFTPIYCSNAVSKYNPNSNANFLSAIEFNDRLYFCGSIYIKSDAGTNAMDIVSWDGSKWLPIGLEFNPYIKISKTQVFNNRLYVGGVFYSSEKKSVPINNIFSIDKNGNVDNLMSGFMLRGSSEVAYLTEIVVYKDKLLFAGGIAKAGNNKLIHDLVFWDGKAFIPIIKNCSGPPTRFNGAIPFNQKKLLVFGNFQKINDVAVTRHAWIEFEE